MSVRHVLQELDDGKVVASPRYQLLEFGLVATLSLSDGSTQCKTTSIKKFKYCPSNINH